MKLFFSIIFLFPVISYASGPAINSHGKPTTQCIKIKISEKQVSNINVSRILKLSELQIKKISPNWKRQIIGILSENWKDCTCGMLYGFWTVENEISIPKHLIASDQAKHKYKKKNHGKDSEFESWGFINYLKKIVIMDTKGRFYKNGELISLSALKEEYTRTKEPITVNVPSSKILTKIKLDDYLKKLSKMGIVYRIFG